MKKVLVACEDAMTRISRAVAAASVLALAMGAAAAQTTPVDPLSPGAAGQEAQSDSAKDSKAAEKPAAAKPAHHKARSAGGGLTVVVSNRRSVGLVELKVSPAGDTDPKKVAGPLAFGRKTVAHLKPAKDCLYDIRGHFADDADTEQLGVELCKDKAINLTDE